jgi:RND family efflux transporter MFP subunit
VIVPAIAWLVLFVSVPGCGKPTQAAPPPPARVTVSRPIERQVIQWDEYAGNLSAPDIANVSARVSGLIERASFQEGSIVHQGDLLFEIDPRPFQADVDAKNAAVAQAQAQADQAAVHLRRYTEVRGTKAISAEDYDTAKASDEVAQAGLAAAKAALESSELNLQWTKVTAPINGRISRMNVQPGNLIIGGGGTGNSGGQPTLLTTIVSIDPIYCYVQVPEASAIRYQKLSRKQKGQDIAHAQIPCYLQLSGETGFPHDGVIDFIDNQVDTGTGTVTIRGVFDNPTGILTAGMFARMRVPGTERYTAMLIPDAAVNANQNERYALVVDGDDDVHLRPIVLGPMFGNLRQIDQGLTLNDLVVVNGVQKARPGAKVEPHEAPVPTESLDALQTTDRRVPVFPSVTQPATAPATEPAPAVLQPVEIPPVTTRPGTAGEAR